MDKASQVLAQGPPVGVPRSYRAIADHSGVLRATLHHRACDRRSIEEKADSQRYLAPFEEKAMDDVDKRKLEKHLHKLTKGAQTSIARSTL